MSRTRKALASPWCWVWLGVWTLVAAVVSFRDTELTKCYLKAAQRFVGGADIYARTSDGVGTWPYPPAMILTVAPLAWLPDWAARILWSGALTGCMVVAAWGLTRTALAGMAEGRARSHRVLALVLTGLAAHQIVLSPVIYQSHDPILAAGIGLALVAALKHHDAIAGALLGAIGAMKVTPGLFGLAFALSGRWRALGVMALVAAALTIFPDAMRGDTDGALTRRFAAVAQSASDPARAGGGYWAEWNPLAQNLSATLTRLTIPTPSGSRDINQRDWSLMHLSDAQRRGLVLLGQAAVVAAVVTVVGAVRWRRASHPAPLEMLVETGAICCGMLLLAPHSSNYHFAIEAFAIAPCIILAIERRDPLMITVACVLGLLGLPSGRDLIGNFAVDALLIWGKLTLGTCVALAGCVRAAILLRRDYALAFAREERLAVGDAAGATPP